MSGRDANQIAPDHKGYSEETCLRCGWRMGSPPLNCQNDDTPHRFPSQMTERDANQLAADVRRGIQWNDRGLSLPALDELVALVGTLQQERDEQTDVTEDVARACFEWKQRAVAAEAALAERTAQRDRVGKMAADAVVAQNKTELALATTRQALTETLDAAETAVFGTLPVLPLRGSANTGYVAQPTDQCVTSALPEEWNEAAEAIAGLDTARRRALAAADGDTKQESEDA